MKRPLHSAACGLLCLCLTAAGGCNIVGYAAHTAEGKGTEKASFILPKVPTAILVTDAPDPTGAKVESQEVAGQLEKQLTQFNLVPLVSMESIDDLRSSRPGEFATMSPAAVARAAGAKQSIRITIIHSTLDTEGVTDVIKGEISAEISVLNDRDETLWPVDGGGELVTFSTPQVRVLDSSTRNMAERALCEGLAIRVARLFRDVKDGE